MGTTALWVLAVVIPASATSLLVLALDVRAQRRRRPRWHPTSSRLTAAAGAALGVAGFGLTSLAGLAGLGHTARAAGSDAEVIWVVTATGAAGQAAVPPVGEHAAAQLPFAPLAIWGSGFDGSGGYTLLAEVPGGTDIPLLSGRWPDVAGEAPRALALLDPAAIVDAARAKGVLPVDGVFALELRSADPPASVHLGLADRPAPVAVAATPPLSVRLPAGAVASAARTPATGTAAATAPAPSPAVGVPATGGGAPLLGGLALIAGGGVCAGLSLRLRRSRPARSRG